MMPRRWPTSSISPARAWRCYVWTRIAGPGGDPWAVGRQRARRETGSFSYRNAVVVEQPAGRVAAGPDRLCAAGRARARLPTPCRRCSCRCRNWRTWCPAPGTSTCWPPIPTSAARAMARRCSASPTGLPLRQAARAQHHRLRRQHRRAAALRALRLPRDGAAPDGQGGLAATRHRVGADGEAIVNRDRTPPVAL